MRDFSFNNTSSLKSTLFGHKLSDPLSLSLPLLIFATHALALTHALSHSLFSNFLSLMSKSNTHMSGGRRRKFQSASVCVAGSVVGVGGRVQPLWRHRKVTIARYRNSRRTPIIRGVRVETLEPGIARRRWFVVQ